jgi:uncharacterized membrane protein YjjP (DUF1212 family)
MQTISLERYNELKKHINQQLARHKTDAEEAKKEMEHMEKFSEFYSFWDYHIAKDMYHFNTKQVQIWEDKLNELENITITE